METKLIQQILRIQRSYENLTAGILREKGQELGDIHTRQLLQIAAIMNGEKETYVSDIVNGLHDTPQSISRMLRTLEMEQLLVRSTDPADRRKTYVSFTEEGASRVTAANKRMAVVEQALQEKLGADTLAAFAEVCGEVEKAMEELASDGAAAETDASASAPKKPAPVRKTTVPVAKPVVPVAKPVAARKVPVVEEAPVPESVKPVIPVVKPAAPAVKPVAPAIRTPEPVRDYPLPVRTATASKDEKKKDKDKKAKKTGKNKKK